MVSKYGFIDKSGKVVIEPQFDVVRAFSEGLAIVAIEVEEGKGREMLKLQLQSKEDESPPFHLLV